MDDGDAQEAFHPSFCTQQLVQSHFKLTWGQFSCQWVAHPAGWLRPTLQILKQL